MPFTPFHFGPGAALKAEAPGRFSFTIFCYSQVVTDLEPGYYLISVEYPVHRFFHTFVGATFVGVFCALSGRPLCQFALRAVRACFRDRGGTSPGPPVGISWRTAFLNAILGTYSHVVLDGIMHRDVRPFSPFSAANPLLRLISPIVLHELCVALGIVGVFVFLWRTVRSAPIEE